MPFLLIEPPIKSAPGVFETGSNHGVDGNLGAGLDEKEIADLHFRGGHLNLLAIPDGDRLRWSEIQQSANGVVGAAPRPHLEPVAEEHKGAQHGRRLVEDVPAAPERDYDRVGPAGRDGDRDQDHHVQRPRSQSAHGSVEEDPARVRDHGHAQDQLEDVVAETKWSRNSEVQDLAAD